MKVWALSLHLMQLAPYSYQYIDTDTEFYVGIIAYEDLRLFICKYV